MVREATESEKNAGGNVGHGAGMKCCQSDNGRCHCRPAERNAEERLKYLRPRRCSHIGYVCGMRAERRESGQRNLPIALVAIDGSVNTRRAAITR